MGIVILPDAKDPAVRYADIDSRRRRHPAGFRRHRRRHGSTSTEKGCVLVDTTCGSVLNVWKMVHRYARDGYTVIIHGKHYHEETRATASQALTHPRRPLPVRARHRAKPTWSAASSAATVPADEVRAQFAAASSPDFDPDAISHRIGLANQTTMLMQRESGDSGHAAAPRCAIASARTASRITSAPSTRSARRPRIARTPCTRCSTPATST